MRCIPLNTNKYMSFSITILKEIKEIKDQREPKKKVITSNLKFVDSVNHMSSALSTLVDNLSEVNKCNCEEKQDKDLKTKIIRGTGKTIIRATCQICNSKQDQLLITLTFKLFSLYIQIM